MLMKLIKNKLQNKNSPDNFNQLYYRHTASFHNVPGYNSTFLLLALMKLIKNKLQNKNSPDNFNQ